MFTTVTETVHSSDDGDDVRVPEIIDVTSVSDNDESDDVEVIENIDLTSVSDNDDVRWLYGRFLLRMKWVDEVERDFHY